MKITWQCMTCKKVKKDNVEQKQLQTLEAPVCECGALMSRVFKVIDTETDESNMIEIGQIMSYHH